MEKPTVKEIAMKRLLDAARLTVKVQGCLIHGPSDVCRDDHVAARCGPCQLAYALKFFADLD